ncbi:MAG: 30S ribosome-binding factor RbfA [Bacteroidales bacterium]|jgi:ribosome-binding factor A|nr:30S ribosome-binding factor RbfA [Bacteroidales bacterium]
MNTIRQEKINSLLQKELAEIFRLDMQPHFPGIMFTVTYINVTSDMSLARVNLSMFPVTDKQALLKQVKERTGEIRLLLGRKIKNQLRIVPQLQFFVDDTLDKAQRIEELLKQ